MIFDDLIGKDITIRYETDSKYLLIKGSLLEVNNSGVWLKRKNSCKTIFFPYTSIEFITIGSS